jgi:hypothetical protein
MKSYISKKHLVAYLATVGACSIKITKRQEMKLKTWILPYLQDEIEIGSASPIPIIEIRKNDSPVSAQTYTLSR